MIKKAQVRGSAAEVSTKMTDHDILAAMEKFGGSFAQALAWACYRADSENLRRIKVAFADLWADYADIAQMDADDCETKKETK